MQVTFRGPTSHLYILRAISEVSTPGAAPGNQEWTGRAFWMDDGAGFTGTFVRLASLAQSAAFANRHVMTSVTAKDLVDGFERIPLGHVRSVPNSSNGFFIVDKQNIDSQVTTIAVIFTAYRREALTVPGFLDKLQSGLVR